MSDHRVQNIPESDVLSGSLNHIPRSARFALLQDSGLNGEESKRLAGYARTTSTHEIKHTTIYRRYKQQIREQRARLSAQRGYTLEDSARYYKLLSLNAEAATLRASALKLLCDGKPDAATRAKILLEQAEQLDIAPGAMIKARERLDKLLGFDSPMEIEQGGDTEQRPTVTLIEVLNQLSLSPLQARALLGNTPAVNTTGDSQYREVGQADSTGEGGGGEEAGTGTHVYGEGCPLEKKRGGEVRFQILFLLVWIPFLNQKPLKVANGWVMTALTMTITMRRCGWMVSVFSSICLWW